MNIIIAGAGEVGLHLAKELSLDNHNITMLDINPAKIDEIDSTTDVLSLQASATSLKALKEAHVEQTDLVLAVTSSESVNISAAILAKRLGAKKTIARVSHAEYVADENLPFLHELGIDYLIYPEEIVANEIAGLIRRAAASDIVEFEKGKLTLLGIRIDKFAPINRKTMIEIGRDFASHEFRIVAIKRMMRTLIPVGNDSVIEGDQIFILTTPKGIPEILKITGKENTKLENIMILGGGRIGRKVAKILENELNIKLIESNPEKTTELADYLKNTLVIQGDGRNIDLLAQEGIVDMDGFIAVTEDAETNIITSLMAKHLGAKKTIAQVDNVDYIPLTHTIGLDSLINKKLIAANTISRFVRKANLVSTINIFGIDAEVFEFIVNEKAAITKSEIKNLKIPRNAIIGGAVRDEESFIIVGDSKLLPGDKVVVFALPDAIQKLEKLFR
jgi:trk system potassium uptake protein TrkA